MSNHQQSLDQIIFLCLITIALAGCDRIAPQEETSPAITADLGAPILKSASIEPTGITPSINPIPSQTVQPSHTTLPTFTSAPTITSTALPTHTSTYTLSPSLTPTYAILRGTVLEQSNCRYGPGAAYLYKYGLYSGNNLEIIGRNEAGTWILVRAIGGTNPCWLKASLMDIHGDVMSLAPASLPLPASPYYGPVTGVSAVRMRDSVVLSWSPIQLRAGDDSLQYPYLIEAWLCQDGQLSFTPIGSWETMITVQDEAGCSEPSHARIYGVEKHGYTSWVTIPWPFP